MKWISSVCLIFFVSVCFGQLTPEFETTMYFEDAAGNKDTLIVGYDPRIETKEENVLFGEKDIQHIPYDSVFEVRGLRSLAVGTQRFPVESKRIYGTTNSTFDQANNCHPFPTALEFRVLHKYLPVKVKWESEHFGRSFCTRSSYMVAHGGWITSPYWHYEPTWAEQAACLSATDSLEITDFNVDLWGLSEEVMVEGGAIDTAWIVFLKFRRWTAGDSPCQGPNNTSDYQETAFTVSPNPTLENIAWDEAYSGDFQLMNISGQSICIGNGNSLDMRGYPSGLYFVKVIAKNGEERISVPIVKHD